MEDNVNKKQVIENIREEIESSKRTRIWKDYVNNLNLISEVVFTRSSGFILELIQNAEDAGLGLERPGVFEIRINKNRVKVTHNGCPFKNSDVNDLCGTRSSKKPEKGTLGYLGIGFKSVFKVTDCPEVYSNGFQFKFDRNAHSDSINTPWHIMPIWIDKLSEDIDAERTTFIIPYREETSYSSLLQEMEKLEASLYLFLRWLKKIKVIDEVSGRAWVLENMEDKKEGVTILKRGSQQQRFKFFRRTIEVPDWLKKDRLVQGISRRANVTQREIAVAFALDANDSLAPSEAGALYGGVYSFSPLGEAQSGAKFPIQADFLAQPGREAINYEAKWNHWLVEEVVSLCKEAIEYFKGHERWKYQFLPAFEFIKHKGLESYDKLFGPKLIDPIEKFLEEDDCIPTIAGGWAKPRQVVRLTEYNQQAIEDLVSMGILKEDEIASVMGSQPDLNFVHPEVKDGAKPIKEVNRCNILQNHDFLKDKSQASDASVWFRSFYLWLQKYPYYGPFGPRGGIRMKRYHEFEFILTTDGKLLEGGKVFLLDIPSTDQLIKDLADELQGSKALLHPDILAGIRDQEEQKVLKGFLTGLAGMQVLDRKTVCKEMILSKILIGQPNPSPNDLLEYTRYCQQILGEEINNDSEFWVFTKQRDVRAAKEVFFPKEFKPEQDWETNQQYVSGLTFISPRYIADITSDDQLEAWRRFFRAGGVKDDPSNGVEEFAMHYAEEKLKDYCKSVIPVDNRNFGYDIEAETKTGEKMHIEVKGQSSEGDAELTDNETVAADKHKETFYLCVVSSIPENPTMHMLQDPARVGKKDKLTIPVHIWKGARWP